jgi:ribosomal protein S18 acetylase RimI-like enzyme
MTRIRRARAEDARALAQLRWELRTTITTTAVAVANESEHAFVERCTAWMTRRLRATGRWQAWVAESQGCVIGAVWMQTVEKIPNPNGEPESFGYISNLYVRHAARGGIGTRLLRACLDSIESAAVDHLLLWPTERSRTLYRRLGFDTTRDLVVRARTGTLRGERHDGSSDSSHISD